MLRIRLQRKALLKNGKKILIHTKIQKLLLVLIEIICKLYEDTTDTSAFPQNSIDLIRDIQSFVF